METIQHIWIGVHLLVGEHTCVENYINSIDLEYKPIYNIALHDICMSISCYYHEGIDNNSNIYLIHPLDEVPASINCWTKRMLLGPDEVSWKKYSPNVSCVNMCVNYEELEYMKGGLYYSEEMNNMLNKIH